MEMQGPTESECRHHWVLGAPSDGIVRGRCRNCGREREYPAFLDEFDRGGFMPDRNSVEGLLGTGAGGARPSRLAGEGVRLLADSES